MADPVEVAKSAVETVADYFRKRERGGKPSPSATPTPEPTPTAQPATGSPAHRAMSDYFKDL